MRRHQAETHLTATFGCIRVASILSTSFVSSLMSVEAEVFRHFRMQLSSKRAHMSTCCCWIMMAWLLLLFDKLLVHFPLINGGGGDFI